MFYDISLVSLTTIFVLSWERTMKNSDLIYYVPFSLHSCLSDGMLLIGFLTGQEDRRRENIRLVSYLNAMNLLLQNWYITKCLCVCTCVHSSLLTWPLQLRKIKYVTHPDPGCSQVCLWDILLGCSQSPKTFSAICCLTSEKQLSPDQWCISFTHPIYVLPGLSRGHFVRQMDHTLSGYVLRKDRFLPFLGKGLPVCPNALKSQLPLTVNVL